MVIITILLIAFAIFAVWWFKPPVYNYKVYQGRNFNERDIYGPNSIPLDKLQMICNSDPKCMAYTKTGWFKGSIAPADQWIDTPGSDLYVKGTRKWW